VNPSQDPTTDPALPSGAPYPPPPAGPDGGRGSGWDGSGWDGGPAGDVDGGPVGDVDGGPVGGPDSGPGRYADGAVWPPPKPPRRPWRRTVAVVALTVVPIAVLGAPLGLLWQWLAPTVPVFRTQAGDVVINDPSPEQFVAADGWFSIVGLGFGVLVAIATWMTLRRDRGPALLLGTVLGTLAAAPVAWQVGRRIGLSAYRSWQDTAAAGASFDRPPDLHTMATLLVPAFAAVIVCTLLAGWSNDPDLELPGAKPGYGNNEGQLSWGSPDGPDPTAAPAPPAPDSAEQPRGAGS
jgi:hypothetical protein